MNGAPADAFDPSQFAVLVGVDRYGEGVVEIVCRAHAGPRPVVFTVGYRDVATVAALDTACRTHWDTDHVDHGEGT